MEDYHQTPAFPSSYDSKKQYFRDIKEELNIWGGMGSDKRISEVIYPTEDDLEDSTTLKNYGFESRGHFLRVQISEDHYRYWRWPITDRGLAFIHTALSGQEVVTDVLRDESYSDIITVAETNSNGRVKHPIETTESPDERTVKHFRPDPDHV